MVKFGGKIGTLYQMLKNAFKKHPLQNRTNVQIKGGGVKGLLNNVQKNCTFLKWGLPLFFSLPLRSLLLGHSWESLESRGGQLLKTLSQGCGLLAGWDMALKSLALQSSSSVIIATAPLRQVDVQVTLQLALDNLILLALPSSHFFCSPTSTSWSWRDV